MHTSLQNLNLVKNKVNEIINQKQLKTDPKIIVVTKTFALNKYAKNVVQKTTKTVFQKISLGITLHSINWYSLQPKGKT